MLIALIWLLVAIISVQASDPPLINIERKKSMSCQGIFQKRKKQQLKT